MRNRINMSLIRSPGYSYSINLINNSIVDAEIIRGIFNLNYIYYKYLSRIEYEKLHK